MCAHGKQAVKGEQLPMRGYSPTLTTDVATKDAGHQEQRTEELFPKNKVGWPRRLNKDSQAVPAQQNDIAATH